MDKGIDFHAFAVFFSFDDVEGIELLRWEDQQKIREYLEGVAGQPQKTDDVVKNVECGIEVSQTSRATCRRCSKKILKGQVGTRAFLFFLV